MRKRKPPEINSGSMADISFLLLTFFLLTSSIDTDYGISRQLPQPPPPNAEIPKVLPRNIFIVKVDRFDRLLFNNEIGDISLLKDRAKEFLANPNNLPDLPEKRDTVLGSLGKISISKGVISLQNDRGTSYDMYIQVQNELTRAVNELKNELSRSRFGITYTELNNKQQMLVDLAIPIAISEAEPKNVGGGK